MDSFQRRAADADHWDVEKMIAAENDPKQRLQLIVLNSMKNAVLANTRVSEATAERLDQHLTDYQEHTKAEAALLNKGIGAWKVVAGVLVAAQSVIIAGVTYVMTDLKDIHAEIRAVDSRVIAIENKNGKP